MNTDKALADSKDKEDRENWQNMSYYVQQMLQDGPDDFVWIELDHFQGEGAFKKAKSLANRKEGRRVVHYDEMGHLNIDVESL